MTMKADTYYIIFGRPTVGGGVSFPLSPPGGATGEAFCWREALNPALLTEHGAGGP